MSDMAILRIGILVAGVLLLAAIFLFGRPKKPSQGRRIETAERDTARVEPSLAGDDTSEQMQDYNDERVSQPELGLAGGTPVAGVESELGKRPARISTRSFRCSWPPVPVSSCAAKTSSSRRRRPAWCSAT